MNIWGKLIGALLGFAFLRHPLGIFLCVLLGHLFDLSRSAAHTLHQPSSFLDPLFAFVGALAKVDGRVSEREIAATERLISRMRLDTEQRRVAIERFNVGKQAGFPVDLAIADLKAWCSGRRDLVFVLFDLLIEVVYAEGALAPAKLALLRKLAWALGVSDRELDAIAAMRGYGAAHGGAQDHAWAGPARPSSSSLDPYAVLGVPRNAGERDIKRAYRKLISQHHPDKLGDVPDALKQRAEERAREINAAYEQIQSTRTH